MLTHLTSLGLANYLWAVAKMHYRMLDKQPELLTARSYGLHGGMFSE